MRANAVLPVEYPAKTDNFAQQGHGPALPWLHATSCTQLVQ